MHTSEKEPYKITRHEEAWNRRNGDGPATGIGKRLTRKLEDSRWHLKRIPFNEVHPEDYSEITAERPVTPARMKKVIDKSYCVRQIMWPGRELGLLIESGSDGYWLATPQLAT